MICCRNNDSVNKAEKGVSQMKVKTTWLPSHYDVDVIRSENSGVHWYCPSRLTWQRQLGHLGADGTETLGVFTPPEVRVSPIYRIADVVRTVDAEKSGNLQGEEVLRRRTEERSPR
jgi:hypothetical protein